MFVSNGIIIIIMYDLNRLTVTPPRDLTETDNNLPVPNTSFPTSPPILPACADNMAASIAIHLEFG